jgi:hypothetical protein
MIADGQVAGPKKGVFFPLPKLDRLSDGSPSTSLSPGDVERYGSEDFAVEDHVDKYLDKFVVPFSKLLALVPPAEAMNLIGTRRNCDKERDRLKAVQYLATLVPFHLKLRRILPKDIYFDIDPGEPEAAWVWKGPIFTGLMVGVDPETGRFKMAEGDGYHRVPIGSSIGIKLEDRETIRRVFKKEVERYVRQSLKDEQSHTPCDEKYWHRYKHIKPILVERNKRKGEKRSNAAHKAWRTIRHRRMQSV